MRIYTTESSVDRTNRASSQTSGVVERGSRRIESMHRPIGKSEATCSSTAGNRLLPGCGVSIHTPSKPSRSAQQAQALAEPARGTRRARCGRAAQLVASHGITVPRPRTMQCSGAPPGTVTVSGTINVHHINFNTTGYNFTGGTLRLQGVTPTITANGGVTATVASVFAGTAGLGKAAPERSS